MGPITRNNLHRPGYGDAGNLLTTNSKGAASLAAIDANDFSLLQEEFKSLGSTPNGAHQASYHPGTAAGMSFWPVDV